MLIYPYRVKDKIYGTLPLTQLERDIVNSKYFQRLRRIKQTSFSSQVFPGANHSRFEHSLGSMHVASQMLQTTLNHQKKTIEEAKASRHLTPFTSAILETLTLVNLLESQPYFNQILRLSALLHDLGHGPLSHSSEIFFPSWDKWLSLNRSALPAWFHNYTIKQDGDSKLTHETYTILGLICLEDEGLLSPQQTQDIASILNLSLENSTLNHEIRSLFHTFVSSMVDCDRIDYLIRDSKECGVVYGIFDQGRLLNSLGFYFQEDKIKIFVRQSSLPALEDYLKARISMYKQIYFHKTSSSCEAMLNYYGQKHDLEFPPVDNCEYFNFDDYDFLEMIPEFYEKIKKRSLWKLFYESETRDSTFTSIQKYLIENNITHQLLIHKVSSNLLSDFRILKKTFDGKIYTQPLDSMLDLGRLSYELFRIYVPKEEITNTLREEISLRFLKTEIF